MNQTRRHIISLVLFLLIAAWSLAQDQHIKFRIEGKVVFQEIDLSMEKDALDSCLFSLGFDSTFNGMPTQGMSRGDWSVEDCTEEKLILKRTLASFDGVDWGYNEIQIEGGVDVSSNANHSLAPFGFNERRMKHLQDLRNGQTRFFLQGYADAEEVYLSGNFCNWSTLSYPMQKMADGWVVEIDLSPGVWGYKFVVDGSWILDPMNTETYYDGFGHVWNWDPKENAKFGNENNLYVKINHSFTLPGHTSSEKVVLSGDFTAWNESNPEMRKNSNAWTLPVYLVEGTYRYKFVLDEGGWFGEKEWILDPTNPVQRSDENGVLNSVLEVGEPIQFELKGHKDAEQVILTGSFIGWSESELVMHPSAAGWYLPYVLGPGNYEYKFIVDDQWIIDPVNQVTAGENEAVNSVRSVGANREFILEGYGEAERVALSGNFNAWSTSGYTMTRVEEGWKIKVFLPKGKGLYKFIVDGNWIHDPNNPQKEHNEYGAYNSVLWVD
ncbi:MAG: hypothetical protein HQ500_13385 [Flavobacteriales bacterium]|nr:hypothetical protein [Flavobacteriales bacterium]